MPWLTPRFFNLYGNRPSELETKYLLLCLFGMGALATWADSEAVLPAYLIGMVLAGTVGKDHALDQAAENIDIRHADAVLFHPRRARSYRSPISIAAPAAFVFLLIVKIGTKIVGVYPVTKLYGSPNKEAMYTTLLMSTGLTFGTISALFGLSHGIIDQGAVFDAGRRRHRQRGDPDRDRERVLSAAPSAARQRKRETKPAEDRIDPAPPARPSRAE